MIYKTKDGEYESRGTMKELEETLSGFGFYRIAKSYLVNMRYVDGMKNGSCIRSFLEYPWVLFFLYMFWCLQAFFSLKSRLLRNPSGVS